jgi:hypothetical protein
MLAGSTSGVYTDVNLVRNLNIAYHDVSRLIWDSSDGWQYDDTNSTELPIATTSLVHSQQDYTLPSTSQRLERVEVQTADGEYVKLEQFDIHDTNQALSEFISGEGRPMYYDVIGRSVMLYPTPHSAHVTLSAGLKIVVSRNVTEFAVTATTTEPGFATPFHRILSYAAAIDYVKDEREVERLSKQKQRLEEGLQRFYSRRNVERRSAIRPQSKRYWRQYQ